MTVSLEKFYDPDIEDTTEKYDAVDKYEYAITDNSEVGKAYTAWHVLSGYTTSGTTVRALLFY